MKRSQSQIIINLLNNLSINQQARMDAPVVNYVLRPFEGNINTEDRQGDQTLSLRKIVDRRGI